MDTQTALRPGTAPERVAGVTLRPGRVVIHDRVIQKVVEETAAVALGVDRSAITVRISAAFGGMTVTVGAALPIPPLNDDEAVSTTGSVVERLSAVQVGLRQRIGHITGKNVTRVNITVTGALVSEQRRTK